MLRRRKMADEINVARPRKILRVLRAANQEAHVRTHPSPLDEDPLQRCLPIRRVRSEITQIARKFRQRIRRSVYIRIDAPVKRSDTARPEPLTNQFQRRSAGIAKNEIEVLKPVRRQILDRIAITQAR